MRYQGSEALNMNYAGAGALEERSRETSFEVLPGGGLDARARRGVSHEFVASVCHVLIIAAAIITLGLVRVGLSSAAVSALTANSSLRSEVTDAKNLNDDLKIERAVLSSNSRISRIATQNYGMSLSNDAMTVKVGAAAEAERAEQEAAQAAQAAAEQQAQAESAVAAAQQQEASAAAERSGDPNDTDASGIASAIEAALGSADGSQQAATAFGDAAQSADAAVADGSLS